MASDYGLTHVCSTGERTKNIVSTHIQFRAGYGEVAEWRGASLHELEDLLAILQPFDAMKVLHPHVVFTLQQGRVTHHHVSRQSELHIETRHGF